VNETTQTASLRYRYSLGATYIRAGEKQIGIQYLREALKNAAALRQTQLTASIERDLDQLGRIRG
jgi:hypothetical protein